MSPTLVPTCLVAVIVLVIAPAMPASADPVRVGARAQAAWLVEPDADVASPLWGLGLALRTPGDSPWGPYVDFDVLRETDQDFWGFHAGLRLTRALVAARPVGVEASLSVGWQKLWESDLRRLPLPNAPEGPIEIAGVEDLTGDGARVALEPAVTWQTSAASRSRWSLGFAVAAVLFGQETQVYTGAFLRWAGLDREE